MTPDSIESRLATLTAQMRAAERAIDLFAPTARQALEAQLKASDLERAIAALGEEIDAVEERLTGRIASVHSRLDELRGDVRQFGKSREDARTKIILAVLAGSFTVVAAIVAAVATIITSA